MGIATVISAAQDIIRKLDDYDNKNTSVGDFSILDRGHQQAAVLEYQPSDHGPGNIKAQVHQEFASVHNIIIRVYRQYRDSDSYEDLLDDADAIITEFNKYPKLDATSGVLQALIRKTGDVYARFDVGGEAPSFLRMELFLEVIEAVTLTLKE
jgi:hypothetical protein